MILIVPSIMTIELITRDTIFILDQTVSKLKRFSIDDELTRTNPIMSKIPLVSIRTPNSLDGLFFEMKKLIIGKNRDGMPNTNPRAMLLKCNKPEPSGYG